jgi:dihydroorotate dehydrogenase (NAD+) catalytic subunit
MLASGILGYSTATFEEIVNGGAGAVVTKSISLRPREGYANPTVVQANCGLINAMGLPNPGIDEYVKELRIAKAHIPVPIIVSVFGYSAEEYRSVAKKAVEAGADAVELNVSCPHVKDTGSEIGQDISELGNVVRKAKSAIDKPVFVKLSPNVTSMAESAEVAVKAGADGLTIMNTVKAMALNIETRMPVLANKVGGLSGPAIKPIALRCVYEVYQRVHVPLIGCGGITDWRDAVEFLLAGASALQIATAVSQEGIGVFGKISLGIQRYLEENQFEKVEDIVGLSHRR